jgi:hypothetical protein
LMPLRMPGRLREKRRDPMRSLPYSSTVLTILWNMSSLTKCTPCMTGLPPVSQN